MTNWDSWNFLVPLFSFLQCSVWKFSVLEFCFTENTWIHLLIFHGKICVPLTARKWIISILHSAHAGKDAMQQEAKRYYYWANMGIEIAEIARSCLKCIENSGTNQQQPEKLNQGRFPGEIIALDPFEIDGCKRHSSELWIHIVGFHGALRCQTARHLLLSNTLTSS